MLTNVNQVTQQLGHALGELQSIGAACSLGMHLNDKHFNGLLIFNIVHGIISCMCERDRVGEDDKCTHGFESLTVYHGGEQYT